MSTGTSIRLRRDTAANWTSVNPTLNQGEPGVETDTDKLKIGNGTAKWTELAYAADLAGSAATAQSEAEAKAHTSASGEVDAEKTAREAADASLSSGITAAIATAESAAEAASDAKGAAAAAQADAEGNSIPLAQKGAASGVMALTASSIGAQLPAHHASTHAPGGTDPLSLADLPVGALRAVTQELPNAEGTITPNLANGNIIIVSCKGATTIKKPSNWPEGYSEALFIVVPNGHAVTFEGIDWAGPAPELPTGEEYEVATSSINGGTIWRGSTGLRGPQGIQGVEGPRGPEGEPSGLAAQLGLVCPIINDGLPAVTATSAIGTAYKAVLLRVIVPNGKKTLREMYVANGSTIAGNRNAAIFDIGATTSGSYTPLWESGSVAAAKSAEFQSLGDPKLAVTAGQQLMFAIMSSETTSTFGQRTNLTAASLALLPEHFLPATPGFTRAALLGSVELTELKYKVLTSAELKVNVVAPYQVFCRAE